MHILFKKYNGACVSNIEKLLLRKVSVINKGIEEIGNSISSFSVVIRGILNVDNVGM